MTATDKAIGSQSQGEAIDERIPKVQTRKRADVEAVMYQRTSPDVIKLAHGVSTRRCCGGHKSLLPPPSQTVPALADGSASRDNNDVFVKHQRDCDQIARQEQSRPVGRIGSNGTGEKHGTGRRNIDENRDTCSRGHAGKGDIVNGVDMKGGHESSATVRAGGCNVGLFEELLDPGVIFIYSR